MEQLNAPSEDSTDALGMEQLKFFKDLPVPNVIRFAEMMSGVPMGISVEDLLAQLED